MRNHFILILEYLCHNIMTASPRPLDARLYAQVKREAKRKFHRWPSAYGSGWLSRTYRKRGGRYEGGTKSKRRHQKSGGVNRWMREEWVQVLPALDGKIIPCGAPNRNGKACRPLKRLSPKTPPTMRELVKKHGKAKVRSLAKRKSASMKSRVHWKTGRILSS